MYNDNYCPMFGCDISPNTICHYCNRQELLPIPVQYNYKCPDCNGEFNNPAINGIDSTAIGNPKCPFCGKEMKGLN